MVGGAPDLMENRGGFEHVPPNRHRLLFAARLGEAEGVSCNPTDVREVPREASSLAPHTGFDHASQPHHLRCPLWVTRDHGAIV